MNVPKPFYFVMVDLWLYGFCLSIKEGKGGRGEHG